MAERADLDPQAERRRVDVAQQLEGERRVALERVLELVDRLLVVDPMDQLDDHLLVGLRHGLAGARRRAAQRVVDRPAEHRVRAAGERRLHVGHGAHARLHVRDRAGDAGRRVRRLADPALVGEVDDRVLEAGQHLARQLGVRPALEQQRVAGRVQAHQRGDVGRVRGHEVRHLDHQVGRRAGAQQVVEQALADDVERDLAAAGRPDVADGVQQLGDVEAGVGAQRVDGEARRRDRAIAIDER